MIRSVLIHEYASGGGLAGATGPPASWRVEGAAMRRALVSEFAALGRVRVVSTIEAGANAASGPGEVVAVGPGREMEALARLARRSDAALVVAPETDGLLLERARAIEAAGARSMGSALSAIALAGDKALLDRRWRSTGVETPPTRVVGLGGPPPAGLAYPVVVKPIDGAGADSTIAVGRPDRFPIALPGHSSAIVQPYAAGSPMSAAYLVDAAGAPHLVGVGRQRIEIEGGGAIRYRGGVVPAIVDDEVAARLRRAIEAVPGLRGWVGLDFNLPVAGDPTMIEINPRPTTSIVGFLAILPPGLLAAAWLAAVDGDAGPACREVARRVAASGPVRFGPDGRFDRRGDGDGSR